MTIFLTAHDLILLTDDLKVGPIRDVGLLDSAAHRPGSTIFGDEAYPTIDLKAATLLESIVRNRALVDGNKRLGWLAVIVFYGLNNLSLDAPDDPAYELVIGVASGSLTLDDIADPFAGWR